MRKILICLDKIKNLNSGLGRVSIDFAQELARHKEYEFTFLVPRNYREKELEGCKVIPLTFWKKNCSFFMRKFDLVHALYQSPKYSLKKARKSIMTIHDLNFLHAKSKKKQKKYHRRINKSLKPVTALAFISQFTKDDCDRHLTTIANKPMRVIYNGSSALSPPSERPIWTPKGKFLFSIGVFTAKKNFHTLIPFLKALPENYSLVIAGDSNTAYGNKVLDMIRQENIDNRIIMPQMISESEKSFLYHNCEAFVFPSLAEGFGLPVIESMSIGKPVFCSDKTSLKEIGGNFAYFWHSFAPEAMKDVFERGMADFNNEIKKSEIEYAMSYTWKNNVLQYLDFYKEILEK